MSATANRKRFSGIPGVTYPEDQVPAAILPDVSKPKSGHPAIFDGDEWFYVEAKIGNRRLWALFPVKAWADEWVKGMSRPENFTVKQLLYP